MKNTFSVIIVLVLVIAGGWFFLGKGKKAEAPTPTNSNQGVTTNTEAILRTDTTGVVNTGISLVKEFTVSGKNFSFTPNAITVKKGDKVKITFKNTGGFHDFKIDEYGLATKQAQSPYEEVLEFIAGKTGSFEYYCSVDSHRSMGMKGILIVE